MNLTASLPSFRVLCLGLATLSLCAATSSCGGSDEPVNFNGTYTNTITNSDNGCMLADWMAGAKNENVQVVVTTDQLITKFVLVTVEGLTGAVLDLLVGSRVFISTTDGDAITGLLLGRSSTEQGCMQNLRIRLTGTLKNDVLEGTLTYGFDVKNPEACGIKATCSNQQTIKGTRPPLPKN